MGCCRARDKFEFSDKGSDVTQPQKRQSRLIAGRPFIEILPRASPDPFISLFLARERLILALISKNDSWESVHASDGIVVKTRSKTPLCDTAPACYLYVDVGKLVEIERVVRVLEDVSVRRSWDKVVLERKVREDMGGETCYTKYFVGFTVREIEERRRKEVTSTEARIFSFTIPPSAYPSTVHFSLIHIHSTPQRTTGITLCYQTDFSLSGVMKSIYEAGMKETQRKWLERLRMKLRERE